MRFPVDCLERRERIWGQQLNKTINEGPCTFVQQCLTGWNWGSAGQLRSIDARLLCRRPAPSRAWLGQHRQGCAGCWALPSGTPADLASWELERLQPATTTHPTTACRQLARRGTRAGRDPHVRSNSDTVLRPGAGVSAGRWAVAGSAPARHLRIEAILRILRQAAGGRPVRLLRRTGSQWATEPVSQYGIIEPPSRRARN